MPPIRINLAAKNAAVVMTTTVSMVTMLTLASQQVMYMKFKFVTEYTCEMVLFRCGMRQNYSHNRLGKLIPWGWLDKDVSKEQQMAWSTQTAQDMGLIRQWDHFVGFKVLVCNISSFLEWSCLLATNLFQQCDSLDIEAFAPFQFNTKTIFQGVENPIMKIR